jgi:hypothetical protein
MKKMFLTIAFLMLAIPAQAADLTFVWEYPDPTPDLKGFKVYQEAVMIKDISNSTARTTAVTIDDLGTGKTCFALTAYDLAGQESIKSNSACTDLVPGSPINLTVQVTFAVVVPMTKSAGTVVE